MIANTHAVVRCTQAALLSSPWTSIVTSFQAAGCCQELCEHAAASHVVQGVMLGLLMSCQSAFNLQVAARKGSLFMQAGVLKPWHGSHALQVVARRLFSLGLLQQGEDPGCPSVQVAGLCYHLEGCQYAFLQGAMFPTCDSCQLASVQVAARRLTSVELLLRRGASLYSLDVNGWTPGHYLCCHPFNSR